MNWFKSTPKPVVTVLDEAVQFVWNDFLNEISGKHECISEVFGMAGRGWRLLTCPSAGGQSRGLYLKYVSPGEGAAKSNSFTTSFSLEVVHPNLPEMSIVRSQIKPLTFVLNEDLGYRDFLPQQSLSHFLHNGALVVRVYVGKEAIMREEDQQRLCTPKTEFVGLLNQGATCYMNSYLQSLFHLPWFRKAVYFMPSSLKSARIEVKDDEGSAGTSSGSDQAAQQASGDGSESEKQFQIAQALQRLFYNLQTATKAQSTNELTKSFGWTEQQSFHQHDVQEFSRVLSDNLEAKMRSSVVEGAVARLFRGEEESYVECLEVPYSSARREPFYDLQLNVKGFRRLEDSLRNYLEPEVLDKENKYRTEKYGLQAAKKGVRFREFPPVLQLQLKRFEYDFVRDTMVKVNDRFEFPAEINLRPFLTLDSDLPASSGAPGTPSNSSTSSSSDQKADTTDASRVPVDMDDPDNSTYDLYAVLVHSGSLNAGHYYSYIRPVPAKPKPAKDGEGRAESPSSTSTSSHYLNAPWFKFDDALAHQVTAAEAVEGNYGSGSIGSRSGAYDMYSLGSMPSGDCGSSAYMLIYVRRSLAASFEDVQTDPYVFHPVVLNDPSKFPAVGYVPKQTDMDDEDSVTSDNEDGKEKSDDELDEFGSVKPKDTMTQADKTEKSDPNQSSKPASPQAKDTPAAETTPLNPYCAAARRKALQDMRMEHSQLELAMPLDLVQRLTEAARWKRMEAEMAQNKKYYFDTWLINEPKTMIGSSVRNFMSLFYPSQATPSLMYAGPGTAPCGSSTSSSAIEALVAPSKLTPTIAEPIVALHAAANAAFETRLSEGDVAREVAAEPDPALDSSRLDTLLPSSALGLPNERPVHIPASFVRIVGATSAGSSSSGSNKVVVAASAAACDDEEIQVTEEDKRDAESKTALPLLYSPSIVIAPAVCDPFETSTKRPVLISVGRLINERSTFEHLPTLEMLPPSAEAWKRPKLIRTCSVLGAAPAAEARAKLASRSKDKESKGLKGKSLILRAQTNPILGMFPRNPAYSSVTIIEERGVSHLSTEVRIGPTQSTDVYRHPEPIGYMFRDPATAIPTFGLSKAATNKDFMFKFYSQRLQRMVFLGTFPTNQKLTLVELQARLGLFLYLTGLAPLRSHSSVQEDLADQAASTREASNDQALIAKYEAAAQEAATRAGPSPAAAAQIERLKGLAEAFPKHPLSTAVVPKWTATPAILGVGLNVLDKVAPAASKSTSDLSSTTDYPPGFMAAVMGEGSVPRELNSVLGVPVRSRQAELSRHEALRFNAYARNLELVINQLDTSWITPEVYDYLPKLEILYEARKQIQARESWNYIQGAMFVASEVLPVQTQRVQALRARAHALTWRRHMIQLQFNTLQCGRMYGTLQHQRRISMASKNSTGDVVRSQTEFVPSFVRGGATEILLNYLGEPVVRRALRRARQIYLQHLPMLESLLNTAQLDSTETVPLFELRGPAGQVPSVVFDITDQRFARHAAALRSALTIWGLRDLDPIAETLQVFKPALDVEASLRRSLETKETMARTYGSAHAPQLNAAELLVRDGSSSAVRDAAEWAQVMAGVTAGLDAPAYQYENTSEAAKGSETQITLRTSTSESAVTMIGPGTGAEFENKGVSFAPAPALSNEKLMQTFKAVGETCAMLASTVASSEIKSSGTELPLSVSSFAVNALLPSRATALADQLTLTRVTMGAKGYLERAETNMRVTTRLENTTLLSLARSAIWQGLRLDAEALEDEIDTALFGPVGFEDFKPYKQTTAHALNSIAYPAALRSKGASAGTDVSSAPSLVDPLSGDIASISTIPDYQRFVEAITRSVGSPESKSNPESSSDEATLSYRELATPLDPVAVAERIRNRILKPFSAMRRHYRTELAQLIMRQVIVEAVITSALDNVLVAAPKFPLSCQSNENLEGVAVRIGYAMGLDSRLVSVQGRIMSADGYTDPSSRSTTVKSLANTDITFSVLPVFAHIHPPLPVNIYLSDTTLTLSSAFAAYLFPSATFASVLPPVAIAAFDVEDPIKSLTLACRGDEQAATALYEQALQTAASNEASASGGTLTAQQALARINARMRPGSERRRRALLHARVEALSRMRYLPITLYVPTSGSQNPVTMRETVDAANAELGARFDALVIDSLEQQYFSATSPVTTSSSALSPAALRGANLNRFILHEKNDVEDDFAPFVALMISILDARGLNERAVVNYQGSHLVEPSIALATKAARDPLLSNSGAAGRLIISEWPSNVVIALRKFIGSGWPRLPAYVSVVAHEIFYRSASKQAIVPRPIRFTEGSGAWFPANFLVLHGVFAEAVQPLNTQADSVASMVVGKRVRYFGGTWHAICRQEYEKAEDALRRIPDPLWEPESIVKEFFKMLDEVKATLKKTQTTPESDEDFELQAAYQWRNFMCCPARSSTVEQAVMGKAVQGVFQKESPVAESSQLCLFHPAFTANALMETMKKLKTNQSVGALKGGSQTSVSRAQAGHEIRILQ